MSYYEKARWLTDKYIYLILGVYPLFWGGGYTNISNPKALLLYGSTGLWLLGVVVLLLLAVYKKENLPFSLRPVHYFVLLFLFVSFISSAISPWKESVLFGAVSSSGFPRWDGLATIFCYTMIFWGSSLLAKPKKEYLWVLAAVGLINAVIALLQFFGINVFGLYPEGTDYYDKYVKYSSAFLGTVGNAGLFGQLLCLITPAVFVYGLKTNNRTIRISSLMLSFFLFGIVLYARIEAAYIGFLGAGCICVPAMIEGRKKRKIAACIIMGILTAGIIAVWFWPGKSGTIWELSRILHGELRDEFGSHRIQIWKEALKLVPERPLFGGGPGTFGERVDIVFERYIPEVQKLRQAVVSNTHNVYLSYLVNMGLLGLGAYIGAIVCSLFTWNKRKSGILYAAFGCSLICCMIQDFFCVTLVAVTPMMWLLWGLTENASTGKEDDSLDRGCL